PASGRRRRADEVRRPRGGARSGADAPAAWILRERVEHEAAAVEEDPSVARRVNRERRAWRGRGRTGEGEQRDEERESLHAAPTVKVAEKRSPGATTGQAPVTSASIGAVIGSRLTKFRSGGAYTRANG